MSARGTLRIYLGAAPGVGKTYTMLDEGNRRAGRGADVVIGFVETHGRGHTAAQIGDLPVVPRKVVQYRGSRFEEMDLDAVLARRPQIALVDELAHTNVPGSGPHAKRWQDVETLLEAGIDVISTLNIQHLESLNDVVQQITGVAQQETVPDLVARAAEQVELVDMTPEALRRRMAHGNIYPPEKVDAALGNYFRPGNLTALRELALLWLADRVEEGMQRYRELHGITGTWETRERVVVALTGGPEGSALIRRAARVAARTAGGDLMAVHVSRSDGLAETGVAALESQRLLVESLGGSYHSVVGDNVPRALLDFARSVDATQIVLGASRRRAWVAALTGPGTSATVTRLSGAIDVHMVSHDYAGRGRTLPSFGHGLTVRRQLGGVVVAAVLLAAITPILSSVRGHVTFPSAVSIYLLVVVITSLVGGFYPALGAAVVGSLLLNYYFVEPIHTFSIARGDNILALLIFLLIAVLVSRVVDVSARRSALAARSSAEAETLSALAGSLLRGEQALPALLERVQETFGMRSVSLLARDGEAGASWAVLATVGSDPPQRPSDGDCTAEIDETRTLVLRGHPLPAEDQRVLSAFAAQVAVAYQQRALAEAARAVEPLAESERARTALLNAVSHDLRTPIAAAKAAVSSLRSADVSWSDADRDELLTTADTSLDRLTDLVTNLLDLSRLQAGVLPVLAGPVGLDDVVSRALDHAAPASPDVDVDVDVDVPADLPAVLADAGLLERVVANLVQNALRYAPAGSRVRVAGSEHAGHVELRVVDHGPGIAPGDAETVFAAFQRRDDAPVAGTGVGLGLAIGRGFTEAMGGTLTAEETPGGGATLVVRLAAADGAR
ncbi:MAG: Two-component system, OmpR family, sensor histidine kinase KdpD [Pseudonocardiales bacterium]|nr:Two-component system, OmpR family, sensor histidine kinase KdpD [Pseudonocardiales bacterium]